MATTTASHDESLSTEKADATDQLITDSTTVKKEEDDDDTKQVDVAAVEGVVDTDSTNIKKENDTEQLDSAAIEGVKERLDFFFSDANVRQDIFVRRHLMSTKNDPRGCEVPGYITIDTLLKFNTIKQYTTDQKVLVHVIQTMLNDKLKLSDDKTAVTTIVPFTKDKMDENIPLSLYLSNIPINVETKRYAVTIQDIRDLFVQYGKVAIVQFRFKLYDKDTDEVDGNIQPSLQTDPTHDKGSNGTTTTTNTNSRTGQRKRYPAGAAFIEFETKESLEKAAADTLTSKDGIACVAPRPIQLKDNVIDVILLHDFVASKRKRKLEEKGHGKKRDSTDANDKDVHSEKKNKKETASTPNTNKKVDEEAKTFSFDWKPGCVIKVKGLPLECDREAMLLAISKGLDKTVDEVKELKIYADYSRGQEDGAIRFVEPIDDVMTLCTKFSSGEVEIAGTKPKEAYILKDDEEQQYWDNFIEFKNLQLRQKDSRSHNDNNHRNQHRNKRHRKF